MNNIKTLCNFDPIRLSMGDNDPIKYTLLVDHPDCDNV